MARKIVTRGEQIEKINKQFKAGREEESRKSEDTLKSATEGEESGSSKTEQLLQNLENKFVLVGFTAGVETTESREVGGNNEKGKEKESKGARSVVRGKGKRVVDSSPTIVSLTNETGAIVVLGEESAGIEESVYKIGVNESYNPKKKGSSKAKTPGTARTNKKRKAAPSVPFVTVEISPTKGRATRSQKRQNEEKLEKTLEESRRKAVAKGKKKMSEPIEAADVGETDLVLQDEEETDKVEVLTPKPKKAKTSTKKSISESKFAVKSRKVKLVDEEEWSGEEEEDDSDDEKDKMTKFGKRTILKGRLLRDLEEQRMVLLLEKLELQGWKDIAFQMDGRLARNEVVEFMENSEVKNGRVTIMVKEVQVSFDVKELGEILGVPTEGYNKEEIEPKTVYKSEMKPSYKVLFEFVNKYVMPRVLNDTKTHTITYGFILTTVLAHFKVPMKKWEVGTSKDHFEANTLLACDYEIHATTKEPGSSKKVPMNSKVRVLVQESRAKDAEIERLKKRLAKVETKRDALRTELAREKE
ncbi:uncharacterized protein [Nicotiana sylvestris]|uniref:uncharacterized protein n=1 Tax=Nicotiana sylvestris TaxID=4096 RepID=UPI00388C7269